MSTEVPINPLVHYRQVLVDLRQQVEDAIAECDAQAAKEWQMVRADAVGVGDTIRNVAGNMGGTVTHITVIPAKGVHGRGGRLFRMDWGFEWQLPALARVERFVGDVMTPPRAAPPEVNPFTGEAAA